MLRVCATRPAMLDRMLEQLSYGDTSWHFTQDSYETSDALQVVGTLAPQQHEAKQMQSSGMSALA